MTKHAKAVLAFLSLPLFLAICVVVTPAPTYGDKIAGMVAVGAVAILINTVWCIVYFWKKPKQWFVVLCILINLGALVIGPLVAGLLLFQAYSPED